jgi:hypothetical protein
MLAVRYKLDQSKLIEQIHEQWRGLKISLTKGKIEQWIVKWENLRLQIISLKLADTFDDDVIFVSEFLRVERRWVSTFCDTWENQLLAAKKSVDFFKITKAYKIVVSCENQSFYANAIILQSKNNNASNKRDNLEDNLSKKKQENVYAKIFMSLKNAHTSSHQQERLIEQMIKSYAIKSNSNCRKNLEFWTFLKEFAISTFWTKRSSHRLKWRAICQVFGSVISLSQIPCLESQPH